MLRDLEQDRTYPDDVGRQGCRLVLNLLLSLARVSSLQ
jgi:hypothetical protein